MNAVGKIVLVLIILGGTSLMLTRGRWPGPETTNSVRIGERVFTLEIADTQEKRILGLGKRDSLCESCGMLFLFPEPRTHAFWMKDMRFSLDIIWLLEDAVVHIERNIQADSEKVFKPARPADRVLEVNAGTVPELQVGERLDFSP